MEKNVEELREFNEECFSIAAQCREKLKNMFTTIGALSNEKEFISDDAVGAIKWIEGEVEAFDEVLTDCGDFCACLGAQRTILVLEKVVCDHVKTIIQ